MTVSVFRFFTFEGRHWQDRSWNTTGDAIFDLVNGNRWEMWSRSLGALPHFIHLKYIQPNIQKFRICWTKKLYSYSPSQRDRYAMCTIKSIDMIELNWFPIVTESCFLGCTMFKRGVTCHEDGLSLSIQMYTSCSHNHSLNRHGNCWLISKYCYKSAYTKTSCSLNHSLNRHENCWLISEFCHKSAYTKT